MRKELKNRWCFLWSVLVNHSDCPGNHTIQHLPPASFEVPVSTCSSDIILSLYLLWNSFDEKWVISSCQHKPRPLPGQVIFVSPLRTGRHPAAPPAAVSTPPRKECLRARSTAWRKKCKKWKNWGSWWSWKEACDPKHKLSMPVEHRVEKINKNERRTPRVTLKTWKAFNLRAFTLKAFVPYTMCHQLFHIKW